MSEFKAGQLVRITNPSEDSQFKLEGEIERVSHGTDLLIKGFGWVYSHHGTRKVTVLREPLRPVFENADRDPVDGDVYLYGQSGSPKAYSAMMWVKHWSADDARGDGYRRVLIFDAAKGESVARASW